MPDIDPPSWISVARSFLGVEEVGGAGNNPTILGFVAKIAAVFPAQAKYASLYKSDDTAWCGVFAARCLADVPISGPYDPSDDLHSWMWADAWMTWGVKSEPRVGAILCFGRHVAFLNRIIDADTYEVIGGNQSSPQGGAVTLSRRSRSEVKAVRWPAQAVATPQPQPSLPVPAREVTPLSQQTIDAIAAMAAKSPLASYSWEGRGVAPSGYIQGVAVAYAQALKRLAAGDSVAQAMVRVVEDGNDVFDHYEAILNASGMATLGMPAIDRLRSLYVILTGLGMRESSGGEDIGRDTSASNTTADTAEAGTWQQSWDSRGASPELPKLLATYAGSAPDSVDTIFKRGVSPNAGAFNNFGDPNSEGYKFQALCKDRPSIAALFCAIGMRTLYNDWGPLIRREAEVVPAAAALFRQVETLVPLDGEILPPSKSDDDLFIALAFVLSQEGPMDAALKNQMLAELAKPAPNMRALLLQALGAPSAPPPPPVITTVPPPPLGGIDLSQIGSLLTNPVIKKIISGQPVTLSELLTLLPTATAILHGQTPPPAPPGPAADPVPSTPPTIAGMSPFAFNLSTGLAGVVAALTASGSGLMGSPIPGSETFSVPALLTTAAPFIAGLTGIPTPLFTWIASKFKKS